MKPLHELEWRLKWIAPEDLVDSSATTPIKFRIDGADELENKNVSHHQVINNAVYMTISSFSDNVPYPKI